MVTWKPKRRTTRLVTESVDGETLVYDLDRHRAHALGPDAAAIWQACDGETSVSRLAAAATTGGASLDEDVVRLTLARLARARLLETPAVGSGGGPRVSRREVLRRAAVLGGLSVLTITVPRAAFAASCLAKNTCVNRECTNGTGSCCPPPDGSGPACQQAAHVCNTGDGRVDLTWACLY